MKRYALAIVSVCLYSALLSDMQITPFLRHITSSPQGCLSGSTIFLILQGIQQDITTNVQVFT